MSPDYLAVEASVDVPQRGSRLILPYWSEASFLAAIPFILEVRDSSIGTVVEINPRVMGNRRGTRASL